MVAGKWVIKDGRHALEDQIRNKFTQLMHR
jgi:hypothetical protein